MPRGCATGRTSPSGRRRCCWWTGLHRLDSRSRRPLRILQKIDCRDAASLDLLRRRIIKGGAPGPLPEQVISDIFLDNLKTGTPWILKQVNIRLLEDYAAREDGPCCTSPPICQTW